MLREIATLKILRYYFDIFGAIIFVDITPCRQLRFFVTISMPHYFDYFSCYAAIIRQMSFSRRRTITPFTLRHFHFAITPLFAAMPARVALLFQRAQLLPLLRRLHARYYADVCWYARVIMLTLAA